MEEEERRRRMLEDEERRRRLMEEELERRRRERPVSTQAYYREQVLFVSIDSAPCGSIGYRNAGRGQNSVKIIVVVGVGVGVQVLIVINNYICSFIQRLFEELRQRCSLPDNRRPRSSRPLLHCCRSSTACEIEARKIEEAQVSDCMEASSE